MGGLMNSGIGGGGGCWGFINQPTQMRPQCTPNAQEVLLIENDINTAPFTPAVYDCVPPQPWSVSEADLADPNRCAAGGWGLGAGGWGVGGGVAQ